MVREGACGPRSWIGKEDTMDRRRFGSAAALAVASALGVARPSAVLGATADQVASPVPEARCIPALAVGLGVGQGYAVERSAGRALAVRFAAVEDDGRCAVSQGVQCAWAGEATVVVEVDRGGDTEPDVVRFGWLAGSVFHVVWGHQGLRLFVVAVGLSGDSATPREDLVLDLIILPDWPGRG
jgi:hypothetical protein